MLYRVAPNLVLNLACSKGAWGKLAEGPYGPELVMSQYELGVLFLPSRFRPAHSAGQFSCTPLAPLPPVLHLEDSKSLATLDAVQLRVAYPGNALHPTTASRPAVVQPSSVLRVLLPIPYDINPAPYGATDKPFVQGAEADVDRWGFPNLGTVSSAVDQPIGASEDEWYSGSQVV